MSNARERAHNTSMKNKANGRTPLSQNRDASQGVGSGTMVSRSAIVRSLNRIIKARRTVEHNGPEDRALYGAHQALGWAAGLDYMNPARLFGVDEKAAKKLFG